MEKLFCRENQTHCHDCGKQFIPDRIPTPGRPVTSTTCPSPECNRGSWASLNQDPEFTVPIEIYTMTKEAFVKMGIEKGFIGLPFNFDLKKIEEFFAAPETVFVFKGPIGDVISRCYWEDVDVDGDPISGCISIPT